MIDMIPVLMLKIYINKQTNVYLFLYICAENILPCFGCICICVWALKPGPDILVCWPQELETLQHYNLTKPGLETETN